MTKVLKAEWGWGKNTLLEVGSPGSTSGQTNQPPLGGQDSHLDKEEVELDSA